MISPLYITKTILESFNISSISWDRIITPFPLFLKFFISEYIPWVLYKSTPQVGEASTRTSGLLSRTLAKTDFCRFPPLKVPVLL